MKQALLAIGVASALSLASVTAAEAATRVYVTLSRSETFINGIRDALLREDAADNDVELTLNLANNDSATQIRQLDDAVAQKYDAIIVLTVDDVAGQHALDAGARAGIPVIFVNVPPPVHDIHGKISIVASNDLVAGRLQMRLLTDAMHNQGSVAIIRGTDIHAATIDRSQGMKEILDTRPGVKVVGNESAHWSRDEAEKLVDGWLDRGIHIDAVAADSDEMALGAVTSLRKHGITAGKVFVGGIDGTSNGLEGIRSGDLTVTLRQDTSAMAQMALLNAKALATGGYAQQYEWVPYQIVLPSTLDRYTTSTGK